MWRGSPSEVYSPRHLSPRHAEVFRRPSDSGDSTADSLAPHIVLTRAEKFVSDDEVWQVSDPFALSPVACPTKDQQ